MDFQNGFRIYKRVLKYFRDEYNPIENYRSVVRKLEKTKPRIHTTAKSHVQL